MRVSKLCPQHNRRGGCIRKEPGVVQYAGLVVGTEQDKLVEYLDARIPGAGAVRSQNMLDTLPVYEQYTKSKQYSMCNQDLQTYVFHPVNNTVSIGDIFSLDVVHREGIVIAHVIGQLHHIVQLLGMIPSRLHHVSSCENTV